jgi:N-acetylmuramoyl-L-alanine amidase
MGLFVLRNNTVPAITIELGYMTDPSDLKFMSQKSGQQEIGMAFARALERFKAGS